METTLIDGKEYALMPLTRGKHAIVDVELYGELSKHKWACSKCGYAVRSQWKNGRYYHLKMHRLIAGTPPGLITDHINRNKLDNRASNLRVATPAESTYNRGAMRNNKLGIKGVRFQGNGFSAAIQTRGIKVHLGKFKTSEAAKAAYDAACVKYHGAFSGIAH